MSWVFIQGHLKRGDNRDDCGDRACRPSPHCRLPRSHLPQSHRKALLCRQWPELPISRPQEQAIPTPQCAGFKVILNLCRMEKWKRQNNGRHLLTFSCSADFDSHSPYTDTAEPKPRRTSQSSMAKSAEWVPTQDPGLALRTAPRTHHEVQQVGDCWREVTNNRIMISRLQTLTLGTTPANPLHPLQDQQLAKKSLPWSRWAACPPCPSLQANLVDQSPSWWSATNQCRSPLSSRTATPSTLDRRRCRSTLLTP